MEDLKLLIATWVREARKAANLSQEELGVKLALDLGADRGHTKANVSHWETKKHQPSIQQLLAIARVTKHLLPSSISAAVRSESGAGPTDSGVSVGEPSSKPRIVEQLPAITLQWLTPQEAELLSEFRSSKESEKQFLLTTARGAEKVKSLTAARDKTQSN